MTSAKQLRIGFAILIHTIKRYRRRSLFVALLACVLLFSLYELAKFLFVSENQVFVEGLVGQYTTDALPPMISNLTSKGLTKVLPDGEATPSAAVSWQVSPDGKDYTFTLNPTIHWQDGTPFTAYDLTQLFDDKVNANVLNQYQISFHLTTPYAPFPVLVVKPLYKGTNMVGLGPYRITNIEQAAGYVSSIRIANGKQPDQQLEFRFFPSLQDVETAYKLGEIKAMVGAFPQNTLPDWNTTTKYQQTDHTSQVTLFFNNRDALLADKNVRQALSYAVNKDAMPGEVAISPIPPTSWAFNPDIKQYVFDTNHAADLLKQSAVASGTPITLATSAQTMPVAQAIAAQWRKLGFQVTVTEYTDIPKNFQAMLVVQQIPADPDQYELWHSLEKSTNISGYSQQRIDKLLEDGRTLQDNAERRQKYLDFQRFLVEDDPALFLYYPTQTLYINKRYDTSFYRSINGF